MNLLVFKQVIVGDNICVVTDHINDGDIVFAPEKKQSTQDSVFKYSYKTDYSTYYSGRIFKIIASEKELFDLPQLIIKDEAERLAEIEFAPVPEKYDREGFANAVVKYAREKFISGFRANKKEFTLEEMEKCWQEGKWIGSIQHTSGGHTGQFTFKTFIESLKSTTLLIPCDPSGNPIINENNEIIAFKK